MCAGEITEDRHSRRWYIESDMCKLFSCKYYLRLRSTVTMLYKCGTSVSWEGNRRSGVALAMHQTLVVLPPTGRLTALGREMSTPHAPLEYSSLYLFTFYLRSVCVNLSKLIAPGLISAPGDKWQRTFFWLMPDLVSQHPHCCSDYWLLKLRPYSHSLSSSCLWTLRLVFTHFWQHRRIAKYRRIDEW